MREAAASASGGTPAEAWKRASVRRRLGNQLLRLVPISFYRRVVPREVIGLCYHVVSDRKLPHVEHLYRYKTPEQFESDLVYLKRHFRLLSPEELEDGSGARTAGASALVTFDDGLAECFTVVRPLLLKHRVPCTFFVTPGVLDNRRMFPFDKVSLCIGEIEKMPEGGRSAALARAGELLDATFSGLHSFASWITRWVRTVDDAGEKRLDELCRALGVDVQGYLEANRPYMATEQVATLAEDGFTIGGHALRHIAMGSLPSPQAVAEHIVGSCEAVRDMIGADRVPFAFPFDADGVDRGALADLLARHPFVGPLFDTRRLKKDRDFMFNRMIVDAPPALGRTGTNLPTYLRGAYWEEMVRTAGRGSAE